MSFHPQIIEGLHAGQSINIYNAYDIFFEKIKNSDNQIKTIIELGTCCGGFTIFLRNHRLLSSDVELHTYDFTEWNLSGRDGALNDGREIFKKYNINFHLADIFSHETVDQIKSLIQRPGRSIVFCDGGDKKREFNLFAPFLKNGDIILAHDYIDTNENFEKNFKNKIWDGHEISDSDIDAVCKIYNLKPFLQQELAKAVWASRIKE